MYAIPRLCDYFTGTQRLSMGRNAKMYFLEKMFSKSRPTPCPPSTFALAATRLASPGRQALPAHTDPIPNRVAIIKPSSNDQTVLNDIVSQTRIVIIFHNGISARWLQKQRPSLDYILLDADSFPGPDEVIDTCMYLRAATPDLPIVLISTDVRSDDFSTERITICDATLSKPFAETRLRKAVSAAKENNISFMRAHKL